MNTMRSVSVLAHGGLGNQLFQYAAARALSNKPRVLSYGGGWGSGHPTLLDFDIAMKYPNRRDRTMIPGIPMRETWRDSVSAGLAQGIGRLRGIHVLTQDHPFARQGEIPTTGDLVLNGYFQHPTWWDQSWRTVAEYLAARAPKQLLKARASAPAVIKVRRSDYLDLGWALNAEWYERALQSLGVERAPVIVLAEDEEGRSFAEAVARNLGCQVVPAPHFVSNADLNDFWVLAHAHQIVTANSSFSWWGAAVAEVFGDVAVAYPEPWLPNQWSDEALCDMGLPGWRAVKVPQFS